MNARPKIDMMEATRLTREGRLAEAMAVLRGALPSAPPSAVPSDVEGTARQRPAGRRPPILDMVPPSAGTGSSWTLPRLSEAHPECLDLLIPGSDDHASLVLRIPELVILPKQAIALGLAFSAL